MSSTNVFGKPITPADDPTKSGRARLAYEKKEEDGKYQEVKSYVDDQKAKYGEGVSTLGMIYNATGDSIFLFTTHNWYGKIYSSFPTIIGNGQWGGFLHVKRDAEPSGSEAAVVYRAKIESTGNVDIVLAWDNPWAPGDNHVYTEIADPDHFNGAAWDEIYKTISTKSRAESHMDKGFFATVNIGESTSPYFEAILTLDSI